MKIRFFFILLIFISMISLFIALAFGPVSFSLPTLITTLMSPHPSITKTILLQLRLPRVLSAYICGGLLALAGTLMQVLLKNPLADPYILGVSGGAGFFTLLGMVIGVNSIWQTASAFLGAALAIILLLGLARGFGQWSPLRLLLTGVVLATGFGALINFILIISSERNLHSLLFWLMGDLSGSDMPYLGIIILILGSIIAMSIARSLNVLIRGDIPALSLGVNIKKINLIIYFLSALLAATAVSIGGTIGFIGLIVPHILRLLVGSEHRLIIPGSILLGGSLLVCADTAARTLFTPQQLPVGIFTAFIGIPVFLYLLARSYQQWL